MAHYTSLFLGRGQKLTNFEKVKKTFIKHIKFWSMYGIIKKTYHSIIGQNFKFKRAQILEIYEEKF